MRAVVIICNLIVMNVPEKDSYSYEGDDGDIRSLFAAIGMDEDLEFFLENASGDHSMEHRDFRDDP